MSLKPWRELITPHQNVLEGTFQESEFAADLNKVVNGSAPPEYQDPSLFFERTFITEGMKLMLNSVVKRLTGKGGDPVVQLQTAFGGGKTHAMMAVYHIARGEKPASQLPGIPPILDLLKISELPRAHVAVLDGNSLSPSQPRKRGSITVNTLWGEMAWQLGGEEGYRMLEKADQEGTSPGKEIIAELFKRFSPCIVLMDETVAYIRQFAEGKDYAGGTFGSNMAFLQALTEASGHVPTAMVLASLPESDLEAGGERGKHALRQIEHLFHRLEAIWKPVSSEEGFEIVRRRLFATLSDRDTRDAVCKAFAEMYIEGGNYPSETRESVYLQRMKAAYPFHPEIFDRLYEDWATLENFQRTRGVLRLMAMVVHRLWVDGNQDYMIMPGSIPMYDNQVKSELIRYLPTGWEPVLDRDVDGPKAMTTHVDNRDTRFGTIHAARRVSRTIFLGSAPTTSGQRIRGINAEHIRLGCTQPGQSSGTFDDALRRLNDQLYYLYSGNDRYWYDTQTNLRREAEDRITRYNREDHLFPEISKRIKATLKGQPFSGIHVFTPHSDIPDDTSIRLVVLPPTASHLYKKKETIATQTALEIIQKRGQQPRLNQNRLIFLCADADATATVYDNTKRYLAWKSIVDDKDALNLDQHRIKEATKNRNDYDTRLNGVISQAYKWVIAPNQEPNPKGGVGKLYWEEHKVSSTNPNIIPAITHVLAENEMLIPRWSPIHLNNELQKWYLKDDRKEISLKTLWNDFCRYPYMPRLVDSNVLRDTVAAGIESKDFFGYASGKDGDRYIGLIYGKSGSVFVDENSFIVQKEAAQRQIEAESKPPEHPTNTGGADYVQPTGTNTGTLGVKESGPEQPGVGPTVAPPKKMFRRFHGSVKLDPIKASLDFSTITQEVIQHFSSILGTEVNISLEIEAVSNNGFEDSIRRTVQENSRTLGFNHAEFEED
ncbi:MAG: ATP-binding protein [Desulfobacterales bacterium]|nr:ATP-binding protein [Desulfobacterales bacterium]